VKLNALSVCILSLPQGITTPYIASNTELASHGLS
jgi:hypothetical protein